MDKYEYKVRAEEINSLIEQKKYTEAVKIADTIDWRRVKSAKMLCKVSELYKMNRRYEDSKEILLLADEHLPDSRNIIYSLCELSIKLEDIVPAVEYYKQFIRIAPRDTKRYILQYRLYEAQDVSLEERIAVLEEYKKRDYCEKWGYELAYLYHRIGLATRCVEECDKLILWFGEGKYVIKAMELKMLHAPLTSSQQEKYDRRFETESNAYVVKKPDESREDAIEKANIAAKMLLKSANEPIMSSVSMETIPSMPIQIKSVEVSNAPTTRIPSKTVQSELENGGDTIRIEVPEIPLSEPPADVDFEVKTLDVGKYNTINLQKELAQNLAAVMQKEDMEADDATRAIPIASINDMVPQTSAVEETVTTEEFFSEEEPVQEENREEEVNPESETEDLKIGHIVDTAVTRAVIDEVRRALGDEPRETITEEDLLNSLDDSEESAAEDIAEEESIEDFSLFEYKEPVIINMLPEDSEEEKEMKASVIEPLPGIFTQTSGFEEVKTEPELIAEPDEPEVNPEPIPEPIPEPAETEEPEAEPEPVPELLPEPAEPEEPEVNPEPIPEPVPELLPEPAEPEEPEAEPEPIPELIPESAEPEEPEADPESVPEPIPEPAETEEPEPIPEPVPELLPESAEPEESEAEPEPIPEPVPELIPKPAETEEPEAEPKLIAEPEEPESIPELLPEEPEANPKQYFKDSTIVIESIPQSEIEAEKEMAEEIPEYGKTPDEFQEVPRFEYCEPQIIPNELPKETSNASNAGAADVPLVEKQITGQLSFNDIVAGWEGTAQTEESVITPEDEVEELVELQPPAMNTAEINGLEEKLLSSYENVKKQQITTPLEPIDISGISIGNTDQIEMAKKDFDYELEKQVLAALAEKEAEHEPQPVLQPSAPVPIPEPVPTPALTPTPISPVVPRHQGPRPLTKEEKDLFGTLAQTKKMQEDIANVVDNISLYPSEGNVLITGEKGVGTLELAKTLIKALAALDRQFSGRVAKVTGELLNTRNVKDTLDGLENGALIVEHAGELTDFTLIALSDYLREPHQSGIVLLFEDTKAGMGSLCAKDTMPISNFNLRIDISVLDNDGLVNYGKEYALEKEYSIDEMGVLALYTRISERQTINHAVTVEEVKQIVDAAIMKAEKNSVGHIMDVILKKRYDDKDMIILREKDFL